MKQRPSAIKSQTMTLSWSCSRHRLQADCVIMPLRRYLMKHGSLRYVYRHVWKHWNAWEQHVNKAARCKSLPVVLDESWEICVEEPMQEGVARHWVEHQQQICGCCPPKRLSCAATYKAKSCCNMSSYNFLWFTFVLLLL